MHLSKRKKTLSLSVSHCIVHSTPIIDSPALVEYTPQAYLQSDLNLFNRNFSKHLVGESPNLVSIAGGRSEEKLNALDAQSSFIGVVQTEKKGFEYNGESNLDLQYAMYIS